MQANLSIGPTTVRGGFAANVGGPVIFTLARL